MIQARGFQVKLGRSIGVSDDQFAGSDELHANDLKNFLEDQDIEAIPWPEVVMEPCEH